jgi:hypothetical protein
MPDHFLLNDYSVTPSGERDGGTRACVNNPYEEQEASDGAEDNTNHSARLRVGSESYVGGRDRQNRNLLSRERTVMQEVAQSKKYRTLNIAAMFRRLHCRPWTQCLREMGKTGEV